ncbi:hypothetical protein AALB16_09725 [Lachnospiraceae bacterium 62-35]
MKRSLMLVLAMVTAFSLTACKRTLENTIADGTGRGGKQQKTAEAEDIELILWTYPVGNWGNPSAVANILSGFHKKYPKIHILVEYQDYNSDDDSQMERASTENRAPDLVFEGPERLVAKWGERGMMADLSDLWTSDAAGEIYESVRSACQYSNGEYYEFPVCMSEHCMEINYDLFE